MDNHVIKNALGTLDEIHSQAQRAVWEIAEEFFGASYDGLGHFEEPRAALDSMLGELYSILLIVLEAAQMPDAKAALIKKWKEFTSQAGGLSDVYKDSDHERCFSPPLHYIGTILKALRVTVSEVITTEQAWEISRLEAILKATNGLVHRRGNPPANEHDLQFIMHDYLSALFPGFIHNPTIDGTITNFIPDCGIPRLSAAIEFKIAHTEQDVKTAFRGIAQDTAGYRDPKWTRFYGVIFQAKPFVLNDHLQSDMKRIGALTWKVFLVNGDTKPKAPKKSPQKKAAAKKLPVSKSV